MTWRALLYNVAAAAADQGHRAPAGRERPSGAMGGVGGQTEREHIGEL